MAQRAVRPRFGDALWAAARLPPGPQPIIDLIADAAAQAAPADRYALRVDVGGIGYERRDFDRGVRRGHAGFYLYAMIYTDLPGWSLDVLGNHAPSTEDWNRLLRTGAEFVVKINVSVLAIHNGEQQVLGVLIVPFTVRGGVASNMQGVMHLLQMQLEHAL